MIYQEGYCRCGEWCLRLCPLCGCCSTCCECRGAKRYKGGVDEVAFYVCLVLLVLWGIYCALVPYIR